MRGQLRGYVFAVEMPFKPFGASCFVQEMINSACIPSSYFLTTDCSHDTLGVTLSGISPEASRRN